MHDARRTRVPDADVRPISITEEEAASLRPRQHGSAVRIRETGRSEHAGEPARTHDRPRRRARGATARRGEFICVRRAAVRTLAAAMQRLGAGAVRDVLYQCVMQCHMFRGDDERAARAQQEHAIAVGRLAKAVCKVAEIDQSQAFVCGLLHDIGHLALRQLREHPALLECSEAERTAVHEVVHTTLGARIGAKWNLPELAIEAARRHHRFRDWEPGAYSKIGHVVHVADIVADHLGVGGAPRPVDEGAVQRIGELGVDPENLIEVARAAFAAGV